ncbi:MAG: proline dehydrogenase family protein [Bacteroidales bacterium]|nr:proline dehydrogenase family protein [Bacteroidales bacterium]
MKLPFNDTRIAFSGNSNKELRRAFYLFKIMSFPSLVKIGTFFTTLAIKMGIPIVWALKPTIFKHFCGGETIQDAVKTINKLQNAGIGTVLDFAAEGIQSETAFDLTENQILSVISMAQNIKGIPFAVFKMTGLARFELLEKIQNKQPLSESEKIEYERIVQRVDKICFTAHQARLPIFIDAEETWIQGVIDEITYDMMRKYNKNEAIVFNTLQMYRTDRLEHLKQIILEARKEKFFVGQKIVRGAYLEKERERAQKYNYLSPIHTSKENTDSAFNECICLLMENIDITSFCVATHNEDSIQIMVDLIDEKGIENNNKSVYSAQLLGMSDNISYILANAAFNVAKYVPYGPVKTVVPYLMRRAKENTSVAGQTSRELNLIKRELKRRNL